MTPKSDQGSKLIDEAEIPQNKTNNCLAIKERLCISHFRPIDEGCSRDSCTC